MREDDERELAAVIAHFLGEQKERVLKSPDWLWEDHLLEMTLAPVLQAIAVREAWREYQALVANRQLAGIWDRIKAWIATYLPGLVHGINQTTWQRLDEILREWVTTGETLGWLEAEVASIFGPERAAVIAVTEATRAYTEGNRAAADEIIAQGWNMIEVWHTSEDGLVCEICGWLDGEPVGKAWDRGMGPPAHPNCRCWTTFEVA